MLASVTILGKLSRGLASRNLPLISLSAIFSQTDDRQKEEDQLVFDMQGNLKKKQRTSRIPTISVFLAKLELLMSSLAFVSVMAPAPVATWAGDPDEGVVGSTRLQLSRQGGQRYVAFWRDVVATRSTDVDKIISLEKDMRRKWADPFRRFRSLQCCVVDAMRDYQGVVFTRLAQQPRLDFPNVKTGGLGGPGRRGGGANFDFSKLPGFDPSISTVKKTSDGKLICKHFNIQQGCSFAAKCKFKHVCDVRLPDGSACGSQTHNRMGHKNAVGAPEPAGEEAGRE